MKRFVLSVLTPLLIATTTGAALMSGPDDSSSTHRMLATQACPSDRPGPRRVLTKFVTAPALASFRSEVGLTVTDTTAIRLLVDSADSSTCHHFSAEVVLDTLVPREWAFYELGGLYFVATSGTSSTILEIDPLIVYSNSLVMLKVLGM